jgi:hypothetical protein
MDQSTVGEGILVGYAPRVVWQRTAECNCDCKQFSADPDAVRTFLIKVYLKTQI